LEEEEEGCRALRFYQQALANSLKVVLPLRILRFLLPLRLSPLLLLCLRRGSAFHKRPSASTFPLLRVLCRHEPNLRHPLLPSRCRHLDALLRSLFFWFFVFLFFLVGAPCWKKMLTRNVIYLFFNLFLFLFYFIFFGGGRGVCAGCLWRR